MSYPNNCGCGGCGCTACQPANTVFNSTCPDPGVVNQGAALAVLDSSFCQRRLANQAGLLVINSTPSGYQVKATTEPQVAFTTFPVSSGGTIGNLVVQGADQVLRTLLPPNTSGLYLTTNGVGQFVLSPLPTFSVPDPLSVTTATVSNLTVPTQATFNGGVKFTALSSGTIATSVGLDASGNLITGGASVTGVQMAMFFEAATSPSASTPNSAATAGSNLVIGNLLYDSGGSIVAVQDSQTLKVSVAGKYCIQWEAQMTYTGGSEGKPAVLLLINGVIVNNGNARPTASTTTQRSANFSGVEVRALAVNDTIQLQLASTSGTNTHVYEARVVVQRFA